MEGDNHPENKKTEKKKSPQKKSSLSFENTLNIHVDIDQLKKEVKKLTDEIEETQERLQDAEIHINLLTRLLTTLCIEKFKMRVGVLKRLIRRVETEAIRESQISHLESLYKLSKDQSGKGPKGRPPGEAQGQGKDPWEDIS